METAIFQDFQAIARTKDTTVGGKAFNLAVLAAQGFPVPEAVALSRLPKDQNEWALLFEWWKSLGSPKLAARSSARGEDSGQASFAGQLSSRLGADSEDAIRSAVIECFSSIDRAASRAYREHFGHQLGGMNVLMQRMIEPLFSGVFFSRDPRSNGESGWLVEAVPGFGESLVSGAATPFQFSESEGPSAHANVEGWKPDYLEAVVGFGRKVQAALGFDADMEWAVDQEGKFWVLQARPITTGQAESLDSKSVVRAELERLKRTHSSDTAWDTQTFAEWTGLPTHLSLSIWAQAFSSEGAFRKALRELNYEAEPFAEPSLINSVFGRACLNLNLLQREFFGKIPYVTNPNPRPHLEFAWRNIDLPTVLHAPAAITRMIAVAWKLQSSHEDFLRKCEAELQALCLPAATERETTSETIDATTRFCRAADTFANDTLKWPFVLAVLAESTLAGLEKVLSQDVSEARAQALVREWMAAELTTVTMRMDEAFREACAEPSLRAPFLETYGHRGPGELDLAKPRWRELGEKAFASLASHSPAKTQTRASDSAKFRSDLETEIHTLRRAHVEREWTYLKSLLELRERWKMEIMKPYFQLRNLALDAGAHLGLGTDIFWLTREELVTRTSVTTLITERKMKSEIFRKLALPRTFNLTTLESFVEARPTHSEQNTWTGEPLSPGIASGQVRIVRDPNEALTFEWPQNVVLVAEATDPGWTPLFSRASAIVVERGGVLSHCAIVAREMGLPAVSQILGCTERLKDGDHVLVDGNLGRIELVSPLSN